MPQITITKYNAFWALAKIMSLLDEVSEINISYTAGDSDEVPRTRRSFDKSGSDSEAPRASFDRRSGSKNFSPEKRWTFWERPKFGDRKSSSFGEKRSSDRNKFAERTSKGGESESGSSETKRAPRTTAYKTTKFKAEKRWTAPATTNKKWNPGKWYKKAGY